MCNKGHLKKFLILLAKNNHYYFQQTRVIFLAMVWLESVKTQIFLFCFFNLLRIFFTISKINYPS